MSDPSPLRASDDERERAVQALRTAVSEGRLDVDELDDRLQRAYTVRTRIELEHLIADVSVAPLVPTGAHAPAASPGMAPAINAGPGGSRWIVSIMGGSERKGRWRIAERCNVVAIMGGSEVDLNDAELSGPVTEVTVFSLMGGHEIRVPDGVDVQVSKFAFMGGHEVKLGDQTPPPGAPVIHIRLISIMGGSSVKRGRKLSKKERREQELREAEERGRLQGAARDQRELDA
ncbi:MAG TPA: DUF1707 domain-containing protein [Solirubrobacteraceae bacterium]|nr:DUF1707 domain-containing protein [Solirubrobacteraceae bacterium]